MRPKIVFVILHYLALKETLDCVSSIRTNINYDNYSIIIIDNGSGVVEDSERLKQMENTDAKVKVIVLKFNLGFARGNNAGFQIAKNEYKADFIVLMNNDILVQQHDFCELICQKYEKYHYAVLGPRVYLKDGTYHSNPMKPGKYQAYAQRAAQLITVLKYLGTFFDLDVLSSTKHDNKQSQGYEDFYEEDTLNYKLHGCCLIFSKNYIDKFDGLNPNTFLYMEEDILFVRLRNNKLISLYSPDLWLTHLEDAATDKMMKTGKRKRRFIYKNHIKSYNALIREIRDGKRRIENENNSN